MQAEDQGASGVAEDAEGQGNPGDRNSSDGPRDQEGPGAGSMGEAGAEGGRAPVMRALDPPRPGRDALPGPSPHAGLMAGRPGRQQLNYSLLMPFPSPMEAVRAAHTLARHSQPLPRAVRKELMVSANLLIIRLTTEDPEQMGISLCACLRDLGQLILNMQRNTRSCLKRG
uniref:L antigen family member 3 n=1 Tax=Pipistrellus kuhlii TaxID=59472 RepID=A0A7J7S4L5_PIPKU|nr:hypothetical protein mPipKuh1_010177 [Pipistrellus kuhlii]